ncbi:MAG: CHAT domain-containing protein [Bacteroidales bacterium]
MTNYRANEDNPVNILYFSVARKAKRQLKIFRMVQQARLLYFIILVTWSLNISASLNGSQVPLLREDLTKTPLSLKTDTLKSYLTKGIFDPNTRRCYSDIIRIIRSGSETSMIDISYACYYAAAYNQNQHVFKIDSAISLYKMCLSIRDEIQLKDETYSKACSNLGLVYNIKGDPMNGLFYAEEGIMVRQKIFGSRAEQLLSPMLNLTALYITAGFYEQAIDSSLAGIDIINRYRLQNSINNVSFYANAGIASSYTKNYSNSVNYLRVAYNSYLANGINDPVLLLTVINGLAVGYSYLEENEISREYFEKGVALINQFQLPVSQAAVSLVSNYGYFLVRINDLSNAEKNLKLACSLAEEAYGIKSNYYMAELENLAYFYSTMKGDLEAGLELYRSFEEYIAANPWNGSFRNTSYYGYAKSLLLNGQLDESLALTEKILGDIENVNDIQLMSAYLLKGDVLNELFSESNSLDFLEKSLEADIKAGEIFDRIKNEISNEESQIKVGGKYGNVYGDVIATLRRLYDVTGDEKYSRQSFAYAEKSKASSLLASTRQSRAMRFHIPDELANAEIRLEKEIRATSEKIYNERSTLGPDTALIANYEAMKLKAVIRSDSLKRVFARYYPKYNSLKSNTAGSSIEDIRKKLGRNTNLIEYYVSDSVMQIYVLNRSTFRMVSVPYGEKLSNTIRNFRDIIINPAIEGGSRQQYCDYTKSANEIYNSLFSPVEKYLTSDRLVIAPHDILSYIPFEALLTREVKDTSLNYRELPYMVNSYDIVYTYSGTLFAETEPSSRSFMNPALTFAPEYRGDIPLDSIMVSRQTGNGMLENISGAREEAIYINGLVGGKLFLDSDATETRFKEWAGEGRIIHLAMHTFLNDPDPMYSRMVFDLEDDGPNDGKLNTYEIYNIPVNAKMIVLSSCNTGSGRLESGEGVMSLARGFFYSGAPTVVMSLWEVDDISGSEIIKKFYKNIKRGSSKSNA